MNRNPRVIARRSVNERRVEEQPSSNAKKTFMPRVRDGAEFDRIEGKTNLIAAVDAGLGLRAQDRGV